MKLRHLLLASALLASPAIGAPNSYPPPGSGGAANLTCGSGLSCSGSTANLTNTLNAQVGATYTVVSGDAAKVITGANAGAQTYTLPQAGTTGFGSGYGATIYDVGAGALTINTTTSTFGNGASALGLVTGQGVDFISDGTNWRTLLGLPVMAQDTLLGNPAASNYPTAMTVPGCASDGAHALTYASHALACTVVSGTAASMTVGTTTVLSGTTTRLLYDNAGVLGEAAGVTWSGTALGVGGNLDLSGAANQQIMLNASAAIMAGGSNKFEFSGGSIFYRATFAPQAGVGFSLLNVVTSATVPGAVPNYNDTGTGIGGALHTISFIEASTEITQVASTGMAMKSGVFTLKSFTVSTLPASPAAGSEAYVTDQTAACTYAAAPVGSGSNKCKVWYNGTAWVDG